MDPLHVLVLGIITITLDSRFADGSIRTIIRHCCDIGKQWYFHSDHSCPTHPMIDNARDKHTPCLLAVEVCCTTEMRKQRCLVGKKLALQGETNSEVNEDAKECYSCCRLGLKASMDVRGCQKLPRSNLFTSQCRQIFTQCCNQESSDNLTHPSKEPDPCGNNGLYCSIFEKCVPHKRWGFVCVHINNEQAEHKMDSRTTSHKTSVLDATTLFEDDNYCQNGYAFNRNKMLCEDVNECLEHPKACDPSHTCQNEPGSYRCLPRLININNELPKSHRHRHADGLIADRHSVANRATTTHYNNNKFFEHRPTLHSKFDANDESMASIDRPTLSGDGDFFLEVNNFVVDMTHIDTTRDKSDTKDLRNSQVDDERVIHPIHKMERRCNEGQNYNDVSKECEELIKCEGRNCHQTTNMICGMKLGKEFCTCKPGFRYNPRTDSCDDLDECSETKHTCGEDERCENTHGSYICLSRVGSCSRGYHHDQLSSTCIDVDECTSQLHNCTPSQICSNLPGSFLCSTPSCPPGMIADEQNRCVPEMTDCRVDALVCRGNKICTNIGGRYSCHDPIFCGIGFKLNADVNKCQDVDECYEDSHNCTGHHMFCSNLIGQFKCECIHGFNYDVLVHSCEDVDECLLQPCPSNARCRNTRGSFVCSCEIGFQIRNDFKHCIDINECSTGIHSCEQECSNTVGSYYCSCQEGFKLNNDGFSCSDEDECTTVDNKCRNDDEMCVNTWGSHRCHPTSCPPGFVRHSNDRSLLRKLSLERDHKQIFLSLEHPSIHRPITSSFSHQIFHPQIHHKRKIGWNWQFNSGQINFDSAKEALRRDPKWPVLTIGESPDVVCKRIPCPPADSRCRNNSVASIQWHQLLLPIGELKPHTPIASIKRAQDSTTSESSIRIVGGDRNSPFEIRRDSGGGGHIHVSRDLNSLKTYELVLSVRTSSRRGEAISEHVLNIIINTTPQFIT